MTFKKDDWVLYQPFPDSKFLSVKRMKALILERLEDDIFYDYLIIIDETGERKKVKSRNLFPILD